jgi:CheY-like chemotaxis protein
MPGTMAATRKVLIVDDDPDMRALIRTSVELVTTAECTTAADGFHALELWNEEHHDVVVLDQRMPELTGIQVARAILTENPDQIVVIFSAYVDSQTYTAAEHIGVRAVLDKSEFVRLGDVVSDALLSLPD